MDPIAINTPQKLNTSPLKNKCFDDDPFLFGAKKAYFQGAKNMLVFRDCINQKLFFKRIPINQPGFHGWLNFGRILLSVC